MIYVLYDDDEDGFCACYAAQMKFGERAKYLAVERGDPPPEMPDATDIYILDFNYSREVMKELAAACPHVVLIDHHVSAQIELVGLPYCHFDTTKSTAVLSWEYFWPESAVPMFMRYVQDQDLWQWRIEWSKEVRCAVQSYPRDYETWERISGVTMPRHLDIEYLNLNTLIAEGIPILRYVKRQISNAQESRTAIFVIGPSPRISFDPEEAQAGPDRFVVPVVNASAMQSEIANNLLMLNPNARFVAYYYDDAQGIRHWGLRSRMDETDVSIIARMFGGGGHKQAAGFQTYHDASYGVPVPRDQTAALSVEEILRGHREKVITYAT